MFLDPFDCGATVGCGGDGWLISNSTLSPFVVNATCSDSTATPFSSLSELNCQCPTASILPCSCQPTTGSNSTLTIDCSNQGLTTDEMEAIVKKIPPTTPVNVMNLSGNKFTRIPAGLLQFPQLIVLNLSSNAITVVNSGDLSVAASVTTLDLSSNAIEIISIASFPGESTFVYRLLHNQKLINFFVIYLQ